MKKYNMESFKIVFGGKENYKIESSKIIFYEKAQYGIL
jgi:hypothetical protein